MKVLHKHHRNKNSYKNITSTAVGVASPSAHGHATTCIPEKEINYYSSLIMKLSQDNIDDHKISHYYSRLRLQNSKMEKTRVSSQCKMKHEVRLLELA